MNAEAKHILSPKVTSEDDSLKGAIHHIESILSTIHQQAHLSGQMIDLNITDSFSESVKSALENPLKSAISGLKSMESVVCDLLKQNLHEYFSSKKSIIDSVYFSKDTGNALIYSVIPKKFSPSNRRKIKEFSYHYNKNSISERFPVIIHVLSNDVVDALGDDLKQPASFEKIKLD